MIVFDRILIHFPEVSLKGKNREDFESQLLRNICHRLARLGLRWSIVRAFGRFYVEVPDTAMPSLDAALDALAQLSGVAAVAPAVWLRPADLQATASSPNLDLLEARLVALAASVYAPERSFAIRVNRVDKRFPLASQALEHRLGRAVRERTGWDRVDLRRPDRTFRIDIYPDGAYLYADKRPGPSGLPVHTGGRVLSLLSGGIDSPVAAYLMAKRGCSVDLFHMSAAHPGPGDREADVVLQLAGRLSRYTLRSRLFVAPYTHFDLALPAAAGGYALMLLRRFMTRTAQTLAARVGALALVTGDSLGQVASQTLENLVANSRAADMPLFRPLIGHNKREIVDLARAIGTYEISIQPYKDCCALLSRHPKTRTSHETLTDLERLHFPHYDELVDATLADTVEFAFDCGERAPSRTRAETA